MKKPSLVFVILRLGTSLPGEGHGGVEEMEGERRSGREEWRETRERVYFFMLLDIPLGFFYSVFQARSFSILNSFFDYNC